MSDWSRFGYNTQLSISLTVLVRFCDIVRLTVTELSEYIYCAVLFLIINQRKSQRKVK